MKKCGACLVVAMFALHAGCQERVVRQRSYYPGQFSHVTHAKPAVAANPNLEQTDYLQDAWRGLGNLFDFDKDQPNRNVMTVEELREAQAERDQQTQDQSPKAPPPPQAPQPSEATASPAPPQP